MKYVVFEDERSRMLHPVLCGEHTTHSQIAIQGCKPVSAGFVHIRKGDIIITGKSESLNLEPAVERDTNLIAYMLLDMGTAFFIQELEG